MFIDFLQEVSHNDTIWRKMMIHTLQMITDELNGYANPKTKLQRLVKEGKYFPVGKGFYEDSADAPGYALAGVIYGPSYLSFEFALSYYGLIPERVEVYTSATFEKKRMKCFTNRFGRFQYRDVPSRVYSVGVVLEETNGYTFQIALPEKALCDKLYTLKNVGSQVALERILFEDLRIDEDEIQKFDINRLKEITCRYKDRNVDRFVQWMEARR